MEVVAENDISSLTKQTFDVTDVIGDDGPWQRSISIYIFLLHTIIPLYTFSMSFLAPNIDHWCSRPQEARNWTVEQWRALAMPPDDQHCSKYEDINFTSLNRTFSSGNSTIPCQSWEYDNTIYSFTLLSQFDLVCDRKWMVSMTKSVHLAGGLGKFFLGHISDWIGRRPVIIICGIVAICAATGAAFSTSFTLFLILRFFTTIGTCMNINTPFVYSFIINMTTTLHTGMVEIIGALAYILAWCPYNGKVPETLVKKVKLNLPQPMLTKICRLAAKPDYGTFAFVMEISGPKYRNIYGNIIALGYTVGMSLLPLIAWLIADSFWIQIAIIAPCFLNLVAYWLPESPRWLLNKGRIEEAEKVLFRAAEINGIKISEEKKAELRKRMSEKIKTCKVEKEKAHICDLLKTPGLRMITLIFFLTWSVNGIVYHGLSHNTNELAGDPFVNFALYGVVEVPAYLFVVVTIEKLGKRNLIGWSMFISGTVCFVTYLLPSDPWWLSTAFTIIGKFFITISYGTIYIYASELFPTVARNIGMASASVAGKIFAMIVPFMRELGNATHPVVPQIIFGILGISSGLLIFLLPDTRKCRMPDTLEEAKQFIQSKLKKKITERTSVSTGTVQKIWTL